MMSKHARVSANLIVMIALAIGAMVCDGDDGEVRSAAPATATAIAATAPPVAGKPGVENPTSTPPVASVQFLIPVDALKELCAVKSAPHLRFELSETIGWAVCYTGKAGGTVQEKFIYRTRDGGVTWELTAKYDFGIPTPIAGVGEAPRASLKVMMFQDENNGWIGTGGPGATVFRTRDGGVTWSAVEGIPNDVVVESISFSNARDGTIFGRQSTWVTEDGGETWSVLLEGAPHR